MVQKWCRKAAGQSRNGGVERGERGGRMPSAGREREGQQRSAAKPEPRASAMIFEPRISQVAQMWNGFWVISTAMVEIVRSAGANWAIGFDNHGLRITRIF
jgi:hypothetical protein